MRYRAWMSVTLPLGAALFVVVVAGGLGSIFSVLGGNGAIVIGVALAVGVPLAGALLTRRQG
ncbi:MAG: hypothetical protein HYU29_08640 [Chloroflexi bacterium]|nr:hypothetical protein [Chloroflexota bacterium]